MKPTRDFDSEFEDLIQVLGEDKTFSKAERKASRQVLLGLWGVPALGLLLGLLSLLFLPPGLPMTLGLTLGLALSLSFLFWRGTSPTFLRKVFQGNQELRERTRKLPRPRRP